MSKTVWSVIENTVVAVGAIKLCTESAITCTFSATRFGKRQPNTEKLTHHPDNYEISPITNLNLSTRGNKTF